MADERPDEDKKQKAMSLTITSCDYGVYRLGEKRAPRRLDALRRDLGALKAGALEGKTLSVSRYDIYFNNSVWLRSMASSQYKGLIPQLLIKHGAECPRQKMTAGWFDRRELTTQNAPIIIDLSATLDGARRNVRVLHSPAIAMMGGFNHPDELAELAAAMRKAAEALAAQLP